MVAVSIYHLAPTVATQKAKKGFARLASRLSLLAPLLNRFTLKSQEDNEKVLVGFFLFCFFSLTMQSLKLRSFPPEVAL